MGAAASVAAKADLPAVFVKVDGHLDYMRAISCNPNMHSTQLLVALADDRIFKDLFHNVSLCSCRVYVMGTTEPPEDAPLIRLMKGDSTPASMAGAGNVFLHVKITAAIGATAAGGGFGAAVAKGGVGGPSSAGDRSGALCSCWFVFPVAFFV